MCELQSEVSTPPLVHQGVVAMEEQLDEANLQVPSHWGRLYPAQENVRFHDLSKNEVIVGKLKTCDIYLKSDEVSSTVLAVVSRKHFSISRTTVPDKFGATMDKIKLKDLSMNGTFVNGELVGKNCMRTLRDNCVIAVGRPQNEVYYYKTTVVAYTRDVLPRLLTERYDIGVRLGTGAFGEVSLVFCKKTGKGYAMKSILKGVRTTQKKLDSELQKLENEVKILRKIKHPNVIQLVDDIDCDTQKFLVLEMMRGKDLFHRITNNKRLTEPQTKLYFYQIASGVQYLHSKGIIHRDLKPENILLATDDVETIVKITDFGLSKALVSTTYLRSLCGTKLYVAPEVLESGGCKRYTGQVDVWSMGVILYVSLSGQTPFNNDKQGKTMEEQIKSAMYNFPPNKWECVSIHARKLVKRMMTINPFERICVTDIFKDPWLQDPEIIAKVEQLVHHSSSATGPSQNKENVPSAPRDNPTSPHSAALKIMSPPQSPPSKRTRMK